MDKELIRPDYLFEVSWEVCNKVGGIYTVLATKSLYLKTELKRHHILVGPDVWMDTESNPDFIEDGPYQMAVQGERCQPEVIQLFGARQAGQVQKHFVDFAGDLRVRRQQAEVGIEFGRRRVIVAGTEMAIIAVGSLFAADDQRKFGVGFQSHHAIDDLCAGLLELLCPIDVLFFIETGFQFHKCHYFFAIFRSVN